MAVVQPSQTTLHITWGDKFVKSSWNWEKLGFAKMGANGASPASMSVPATVPELPVIFQ